MAREDAAASDVDNEISPAVCRGLGNHNRRSVNRDSRQQSEAPSTSVKTKVLQPPVPHTLGPARWTIHSETWSSSRSAFAEK